VEKEFGEDIVETSKKKRWKR